MVNYRLIASFAARIIVVSFRLLELITLLIDSIVGQMHAHIVHVIWLRTLVGYSCEPGQAELMYIDT